MERTTFRAAPGWATDHNRDRHTHTPIHLCRHIDDLVKTAGDEVDELHLSDWAHAHQRSAHGGANNRRFGHRSIDNTIWPELFQQARADLKGSSVFSNIFTQEEDRLIAPPLFANPIAYCF